MMILLISANDFLYESVPDDISARHFDDADTVDSRQAAGGIGQSAGNMRWQVDLRNVARHDDFRPHSHAGQEHHHLGDRGVLSLVENDERVVQRSSPHEGQRHDLHDVPFHIAFDRVKVEDVVQGIQERTEIRVDLREEIARQKPQLFTRLHCRTNQDDLPHLFAAKCAHRHGDGQVRLAATGRTDAEDQVVLLHFAEIVDLALGPGPDLDVGGRRGNFGSFPPVSPPFWPKLLENAAHVVVAELALPFDDSAEFLENLKSLPDVVFVPSQPDFVAAKNDVDSEKFSHLPEVLVARPKKGANLVMVREFDRRFRHASLFYFAAGRMHYRNAPVLEAFNALASLNKPATSALLPNPLSALQLGELCRPRRMP